MSSCPHCGNKYGCSCSGGSAPAKASDGSTVCTKCLSKYEEYIALMHINKNNEAKKPK